jgi:hypothetical protein
VENEIVPCTKYKVPSKPNHGIWNAAFEQLDFHNAYSTINQKDQIFIIRQRSLRYRKADHIDFNGKTGKSLPSEALVT